MKGKTGSHWLAQGLLNSKPMLPTGQGRTSSKGVRMQHASELGKPAHRVTGKGRQLGLRHLSADGPEEPRTEIPLVPRSLKVIGRSWLRLM